MARSARFASIPPDEGVRPRYGATCAALADIVAKTGMPGKVLIRGARPQAHRRLNEAWNFTCLSQGRSPSQYASVSGHSLLVLGRCPKDSRRIRGLCHVAAVARRTSQLLKIWRPMLRPPDTIPNGKPRVDEEIEPVVDLRLARRSSTTGSSRLVIWPKFACLTSYMPGIGYPPPFGRRGSTGATNV